MFRLLQIGDISCKSGYVGPVHQQICHEISYIVTGRGEFYMNGMAHPVKKGDICLNTFGELHYTKSSMNDPLRFFYIGFTFREDSERYANFRAVVDMFSNGKDRVFADRLNIHSIFINAFSEFINSSPMSTEVLESCIQQMLCYTYRDFLEAQHNNVYYQKQRKGTPEEIVYDIINYIDQNITRLKRLTDISDHLGYCYPYLSALFSQKVGMTINEYVNETKLKMAEKLLGGDASITEIAEALGYDSIHSFSRVFKKHKNMSPSAYRQKCASQGEANSAGVLPLGERRRRPENRRENGTEGV